MSLKAARAPLAVENYTSYISSISVQMGSLLTGGALHAPLVVHCHLHTDENYPPTSLHYIGLVGLSLMTPVRVVTVRQVPFFSICILVLELCKVHPPVPPLLLKLHPSPLHLPTHTTKMHLVMLRSPSYYGSCSPA